MMRGFPVMLWWVLPSLLWTWWAFFRKRVTIQVAEKNKTRVRVSHWRGGSYSRRGYYEVDRYFLTDTTGQNWVVSRSAYDLAEPGSPMELRQWVEEWRPVR